MLQLNNKQSSISRTLLLLLKAVSLHLPLMQVVGLVPLLLKLLKLFRMT